MDGLVICTVQYFTFREDFKMHNFCKGQNKFVGTLGTISCVNYYYWIFVIMLQNYSQLLSVVFWMKSQFASILRSLDKENLLLQLDAFSGHRHMIHLKLSFSAISLVANWQFSRTRLLTFLMWNSSGAFQVEDHLQFTNITPYLVNTTRSHCFSGGGVSDKPQSLEKSTKKV